MPYIEPRSKWGAKHENGDMTLKGLADEVAAHHTTMAQLSPNATVEQERAEMRNIERVGESRFGKGISYNTIVFPSGRAYEGVSWNRRGTHTGGHNSTVRSICFAGNYDIYEPTPAQIATAAAIYADGRGKLWKSNAPVKGHRDYKATGCPGKNVYKHLQAIKSGNTGSVPNPGTQPPVKPKPPSNPHNPWGFGSDYIKNIQRLLNSAGYRLDVDGSLGPATSAAVKAFQKKNGLAVDGAPGPATKAKLEAVTGSKPVAPKPEPKLSVDGQFGPATVAALQRYLGTTADGVVSGQVKGDHNANLHAAAWGSGGSEMVRELQRRLKARALYRDSIDGNFGPNTIRGLQRYLGTTVDGVISSPSAMVTALQNRLNDGNLGL